MSARPKLQATLTDMFLKASISKQTLIAFLIVFVIYLNFVITLNTLFKYCFNHQVYKY